MDTKKKELVGDFKNGGREWQPQRRARGGAASTTSRTRSLGKAIPYGVYDVTSNEGWVSVGHRPRHGAVRGGGDPPLVEEDGVEAAIRERGRLLITADGGGSNGSRYRLWKVALQELADETGAAAPGVPLPAGDEQVEQDRAPAVLPHHAELAGPPAGQPRGDRQPDRQHHHERGPEASGGTRRGGYPTGIKVTDENWPREPEPAAFHGEWNYCILPRQPKS